MRTHTQFSARRSALVGLVSSALCLTSALAQDMSQVMQQEASAQPPVGAALGGGLLQLLVAVIQLVVALSIAAYAIKKGLDILSKLLNKGGAGLDMWQEIRGKNVSVAVVGASVMVSYCNVIGSGINSMSHVLGNITSQSPWMSLNGLAAALVNLVVAIAVASFAITVVFRVMDKLTGRTDDIAELKANNLAIGVIYAGLIFGVSFLVSAGVTSVGMGVNAVLAAMLKMIGMG